MSSVRLQLFVLIFFTPGPGIAKVLSATLDVQKMCRNRKHIPDYVSY